MKTLILETSTEKGLIALAKEGTLLAAVPIAGGPTLSKTLALEVNYLLKKHAFEPRFIAVGTGPGSYTGIRVGAALAKTLAFGWKIPLFGFCSLSAFVPSNSSSWAVLVDARMGGVYTLSSSQASPALLSLAAAETELQSMPLLASPHPDLVKKRLPLNGSWVETSPNPELLAALAHRQFLLGDPPPLTLSYLAFP